MEQKIEGVPYETSSGRDEKLYNMLLEAIPSLVLIVDRDTRVISVNRSFLVKSRRSISNTIGHQLKDVFPPFIFDQMGLARRIHQVFKKNQPTTGQRMSYRTPGFPQRIYYYRLLPISQGGDVENVILLMDDVTEQVRLSEEVRRIESHLASVVESASDIVLSTDMKGIILSWNPAAEKISGYSFDEVREQLFFEYFKEENIKEIEDVFSRLKMGKKSEMAEWNLSTKNKGNIYASWVCSPMMDEKFKATGIVAVGRDLTERRKLEVQLHQSQKFAALGVMAGGIAHEIRNPLAICSSAAQFLMDDDITPEFIKECAEKIHKGIQRASMIIENLLRFARPSAKSDSEHVNLTSLIKETLTLIANQARIQKVEIKSHCPAKDIVISGNAGLLQQVFINLFLNGIEAMQDGGILNISIKKKSLEALVCIADTGCGIPTIDVDKIFDPFYTTSSVRMGTGLGLSICYSIIQQHAGTIDVESIEGKGSTFIVRLPII
ncbi:MAG: PAS domain S-box protein [Deltaproteobacteria bacterium]|nr:PAS domain S-box protein [Deltaproteobacteria bacterium]